MQAAVAQRQIGKRRQSRKYARRLAFVGLAFWRDHTKEWRTIPRVIVGSILYCRLPELCSVVEQRAHCAAICSRFFLE
jgi:hypothetical protein